MPRSKTGHTAVAKPRSAGQATNDHHHPQRRLERAEASQSGAATIDGHPSRAEPNSPRRSCTAAVKQLQKGFE
eukprot:7251713-Alexandrium_andersonii.AAC.1